MDYFPQHDDFHYNNFVSSSVTRVVKKETRIGVSIGKTNDKTRYCPKCFSELPEDANYCPKCGKCMREQFKYEQGYIGEKSKTVTVGFQDKAIKL